MHAKFQRWFLKSGLTTPSVWTKWAYAIKHSPPNNYLLSNSTLRGLCASMIAGPDDQAHVIAVFG